MAFGLSFSPEFFFNEGEPYDFSEKSDRPTSVWQAIISMSDEEWRDIAVDVFGMGDDMIDYLSPETVLDKVRETGTCTDLRSPVEVWIDPDGHYTVSVYERKD
jgi:hypothetical protein